MIPGFDASFMGAGNDKHSAMTVKRYITIIESMTDKELDSTNVKIFSEPSRVMRLARGSGGCRREEGRGDQGTAQDGSGDRGEVLCFWGRVRGVIDMGH